MNIQKSQTTKQQLVEGSTSLHDFENQCGFNSKESKELNGESHRRGEKVSLTSEFQLKASQAVYALGDLLSLAQKTCLNDSQTCQSGVTGDQ